MVFDEKKKIKEEIEKTMNVFERLGTIDGNPYLYTRIRATLDSRASKPGVARLLADWVSPRAALIAVLLVLNLLSAIFFIIKQRSDTFSNMSFIGSFTDGYYLSTDDDVLTHLNEKE